MSLEGSLSKLPWYTIQVLEETSRWVAEEGRGEEGRLRGEGESM